MDRTGKGHMGHLDDDYKPNMTRNRVSTDPQSTDRNCSASYVLRSKYWRSTPAAGSGELS